jgi:hypothetical protein
MFEHIKIRKDCDAVNYKTPVCSAPALKFKKPKHLSEMSGKDKKN